MRILAHSTLPRFSALPQTLLAGILLLAASLPTQAAPSEGTTGLTVTGRSLNRLDSPARPGTLVAAAPQDGKPAWRNLTPVQQQALQPLAAHWDHLSEERRRKWLAISRNYPRLSTTEQIKLHRRMSEWITLSQQQRNQARQNFTKLQQLTPAQKTAEWEAYQALSPEAKRKLAARAPAKPAGLATGRPGTMPKLTSVPRRAPATGARMADISTPVQPHTLLPRQDAPRSEEQTPDDDEPTE